MLGKIFFTLLTLVGLVAYLQGETRTYLVKRAEHFPQDRYLYMVSPQEYKFFVDTGKKSITEAGGQPFRMTSYEINYDGKYALWNVSFKDEDERWHIGSMERQGYIVMLSSSDVITTYDPRLGGNRTELEFKELAYLPTDFYKVEVSTP